MEVHSIWCMFFASVVSWQYHPGNKQRLTMEESAAVADEMLKLFIERRHVWEQS